MGEFALKITMRKTMGKLNIKFAITDNYIKELFVIKL